MNTYTERACCTWTSSRRTCPLAEWAKPQVSFFWVCIKSVPFMYCALLKCNLLAISDFGLSELYISNRKHRAENPEVIGSPAAGTLRYMSPYAHRHRVISRRDDLISLGYVIVYLSKQKLSWMSQMAEEKPEKSERFLKIKTDTSIEVSGGAFNSVICSAVVFPVF